MAELNESSRVDALRAEIRKLLGITTIYLNSTECPICLDDKLNIGDYVVYENCRHCVCSECYSNQPNVSENPVCPLCRTPSEIVGFLKGIPIKGLHATTKRQITAFDSSNLSVSDPAPPYMKRQITCGGSASAGDNSINTMLKPHIRQSTMPIKSIPESATISEEVPITIVHGITTLEDGRNIGSIVVRSKNNSTESNIGNDYIITIDDSGSMEHVRENIKQGIKQLIEYLGPNDRITIIYFSDTSTQLFSLQNATSINKSKMNRLIDEIYLGNGTNFIDAFRLSSEIIADMNTPDLSQISNKVIYIFMSDGEPNEPTSLDTPQVNEFYEELDKLSIPSSVYIVSFGSEVHAENLTALLRPSEKHNYFHVETPELFEQFLTMIQMSQNPVCGTNVIIQFEGILISNSQATRNTFPIGSMSNGETIVISFVSLPEQTPSICINYTCDEDITINSEHVELNPLVMTQLYNYRVSIRELTGVSHSDLPREEKLAFATRIRDASTPELYGDYYDEIMQVVEAYIKSMTSHNITAQNQFTQFAQSSDAGVGITQTVLARAVSNSLGV